MKKNLLTIAFLSLCSVASAQLTYVGDAALVHIQDQALVYSGGGVKLDGTAKVTNIGDFMVVSPAQNFEVASTADFRLKYVSSGVYGQLYIKDMPQTQITGKINKEYVDVVHGATGRQQVALPFYDLAVTDLQAVLPYINITNSALTSTGRWNKRSVFKWNNATAAFDQLTSSLTPIVGKPTDYYILSRRNFDGTIAWDPTLTAENPDASLAGTITGSPITAANTMKKIFKGVPVSDVDVATTSVALSGSFNGSYGTGGAVKNQYNEKYNTYVDDPFVTDKWLGDYGYNIYQHGNPFLTNIDLSLIKKGTTATDDENAISNLNGIFYYSSGIERGNTSTTYTSATGVKVTFDSAGDIVGGTANDLVIKPMQEFMIKLADNSAQTLKFNNTRRFAQTARSEGTPYSVTAARVSSPRVVTKQLGVILLNANDEEIGRTFYVVNTDAVTGYAPNQARMQATSDNTSIFTKEEQLDGGADANTSYDLYINEANEDTFQGKLIPLVINNANAAKLKFFLIEGGNVIPDNNSLSNGKSFYFSDNGTYTKLNSGATVNVTNTNYTYGLYYNQPAGALGTSELLRGQTVVAKKGSGYVVRFNKNWKSADIDVYSVSGQLLHSAKKVSTSSDYQLPLVNSGNTVYVVKVKSENGEIVTKKIIK